MMRMLALLKGLHNDESGQGLVEYLLVVALVEKSGVPPTTASVSLFTNPLKLAVKVGLTAP